MHLFFTLSFWIVMGSSLALILIAAQTRPEWVTLFSISPLIYQIPTGRLLAACLIVTFVLSFMLALLPTIFFGFMSVGNDNFKDIRDMQMRIAPWWPIKG